MVYNNPLKYNSRQLKGQLLARENNSVIRIDDLRYRVKSQSSKGEYDILSEDKETWKCTCPDYLFRNEKCKHIFAVEFSFTLREQVKQQTVIVQQVNVSDCLFCHSLKLKKYGIRRNKSGDIQRFLCVDCNRTFSINIGFEKMKHNPQSITTAIQLYFSGESLRNTQHSLKLLGVDVSHQTVYNWIDKYIGLMKKYVEKLKPNVGDTWRADELWVKFRNDMKYVFALMDNDTRFWLAQEIADTKFNHDARNLFKEGKVLAGKNPDILITDGLPSYRDAFKKEFYTMKKPRTEHINAIKMSGDRNNNRMERLNNEVRSREKTMRGLKKKDTPIIDGYQIYHNYIREHMALDGLTPAEVAGIKVEGKNKWITLIQNAKKNQQT